VSAVQTVQHDSMSQCCDADTLTTRGQVEPVQTTNSAGHQHDTAVKSNPADAEVPEPVSKHACAAASEAAAETAHGVAAGMNDAPAPKRISLMPKETDALTPDAASILGEKSDKPHSLLSVAMHAVLHKPVLLFAPAIPAALLMGLMGMSPSCAVTEDEMPFAGYLPWLNSRQSEWVMSRVLISLAFLFASFIGPGLCTLELMDKKAVLAAFLIMSIPFCLGTSLITTATSCDSSDLMLVLYVIVIDGLFGSNLYVVMTFLAANRMRGCERWWNPTELRRRSVVGLGTEIMGFGLFCTGAVFAIVYIAIDIIWVAPNPVVAPFRPIFTALVKKFCYGSAAQGFQILGNSFKIWGLLTVAACLGLNTAFAAVQCDSWGNLVMFIFVDCLAFCSRIWCHSGKGNNTKLGFFVAAIPSLW